MNKKITFSSDVGEISFEDINNTSRLSEDYFQTHIDPEQININEENKMWIYKNIPNSVNVVKFGDEVIGFSFILPCSKKLMDKFVSKKINEAQLFDSIKKLDFEIECIYLCAVIIKPEFRGEGLGSKATLKSISGFAAKMNKKPILFYWAYSKEGDSLAKRVSRESGFNLKKREE
jgi:hypothetical protein